LPVQGEWFAKKIDNPAYVGEWKPKQIDNPDFEEGVQLAAFDASYIGYELWIVNNGECCLLFVRMRPFSS